MSLIKTKSFDLAVYTKGDVNSPKLAFVLPGRLDSKDYINITSLVDCLADKGYFVLSFDHPGTWESPGAINLYTSTNYIKVVNELIEYYGNKPTLLAGVSRGGSVAMLVGPKNPNVTHIISIFSYYGPSDYPDKSEIINGNIIEERDYPPGNTESTEQKSFELPLSYFEDIQKYNALPGLKNCTKPKLFFYGTKDEIVYKKYIIEAFNKSAEPKELVEIDCDHAYRYYPDKIIEINAMILEFLNKYPD